LIEELSNHLLIYFFYLSI